MKQREHLQVIKKRKADLWSLSAFKSNPLGTTQIERKTVKHDVSKNRAEQTEMRQEEVDVLSVS